jgi:hypothetical protein
MSGSLRSMRRRTLILALLAAAAGAGIISCTNDPFDPESVANQRPVARIFISPTETDSLSPTSYYHRTFYWSGSDADGFVVEFYVTLETPAGAAAPWDTTARTDTTMTFTTDDEGHAEVMLRVACRDDRGAVSDTVSQYIPLRNFPPVLNFEADFDTVRWSFGAANFRLFTLDLDGNETLEPDYRYKLDTADTTIVRDYGAPGADPALCWVRRSFASAGGDWTFGIDLHDLTPSPVRTLTVAVSDEARAEARLDWTWEVREARGPVLLVADGSPFLDELYYAAMDSFFGPGQWSVYSMRNGLPDAGWVLLETFRQFEAVWWYTGSSGSQNLVDAVNPLRDYLNASPPVPRGRLLLVSRAVTGAYSDLPYGFIQTVLGVSPTASPPNIFYVPAGNVAEGQQAWLPDLASAYNYAGTIGLQTLTGTEPLYRLEYCRTCYDTRPPYDPVIAVRRPERSVDPQATVVVISTQLEYYDRAQTLAALRALLTAELGVSLP